MVGDTVNLAQRLQDLARPAHQIVLADSTYRTLEQPVEADALDPLTVKGRDTPVLAYRITVPPATSDTT
ncbi:MAG: adenylate/guanylate cyclase domain-containing protein [Acidimicrobiia bacterium]